MKTHYKLDVFCHNCGHRWDEEFDLVDGEERNQPTCPECHTGLVSWKQQAWRKDEPTDHDPVNHPAHYTAHPSGVECIQITEHMNFCIGNAVKYLWRADHKNGLEDLKKAAWYVQREIERREQQA